MRQLAGERELDRSCDFCAQRPPPDQNSDSFHAAPSAGIRIASRKRPAVRLSICDFKRSVSLSATSSHASHPQVGKAAVHQQPKRTRTPGNAENAKTMGSASDTYVERKWVGYYGDVMAYRRDNSTDGDLAQLSPDYSDQEIGHIWDGNKFATPYLLPEVVALDLTKTNKLSVPLILFEGRHDRNVNSEVAAAWFDTVEAPEKQLVWFEHSAHIPMTEEPGKFLLSLVRYARPIAEKAAT